MSYPGKKKINEVIRRTHAQMARQGSTLAPATCRELKYDAVLNAALEQPLPCDDFARAEAETERREQEARAAEHQKRAREYTGWRFMYLTRGERKLRELRTRLAKWLAPWLEGDEWNDYR
jgi:hypothetical protein